MLEMFVLISIHAAREGGDLNFPYFGQDMFISIHAAREGGDHNDLGIGIIPGGFQSTPPVKAATCFEILLHCNVKNFNPRRP